MSSLIRRCATVMVANIVKSPNLNGCQSRYRHRNILPPISVTPKEKTLEEFLQKSEPMLKIQENDKETYVEAIPFSTGRDGKVINIKSEACALCRLNLKNLNYTDVMILSQFLRQDGSLVTYQESKLCSKQYRTVQTLIRKAQRCNLIQRPADYLVPGPWHDLNTYLEPDRKRDQPMKVVKKQYWKM